MNARGYVIILRPSIAGALVAYISVGLLVAVRLWKGNARSLRW